MEGISKIIRFTSGGPPLEVNINTTIQKGATDNDKGKFSENRCITYTLSLGGRVLSLNIAQVGYADRVNNVVLKISEKNGEGSSAKLKLEVIGNDRYGVLSKFTSDFSGSYDSIKEQYCVPPLPNTEIFRYLCPETGSEGFFSLEKKAINDVVKSVMATHNFVIGDETLNVKVKITYDKRVGLNVEVEDPVKLTKDNIVHDLSSIQGKMKSKMEASTLAFYRNTNRQPPPNSNNIEEHDRYARDARTILQQNGNIGPFRPIHEYSTSSRPVQSTGYQNKQCNII